MTCTAPESSSSRPIDESCLRDREPLARGQGLDLVGAMRTAERMARALSATRMSIGEDPSWIQEKKSWIITTNSDDRGNFEPLDIPLARACCRAALMTTKGVLTDPFPKLSSPSTRTWIESGGANAEHT